MVSVDAGILKGPLVRKVVENRLHGRRIGPALSSLRSIALTLLRLPVPAPYIPDAQRIVEARQDDGLALLTTPLLEH